MTRDEAVALIQEQLGFRTTLSSNIITHLQLAQTTLEAGPTKPWFLISEDSFADTTAEEQRIAIPTTFLQEVEEAVLRYVPDDAELISDEIDLIKDDYDVLRKNYADSESGEPEAYCLLDGYFRLFPVPDDVYRLRMIYYKQDTVLSTNVENNWLKYVPLLLIGKAGRQIATALRDITAATVFQNWENEGRIILLSQTIAREMANRNMQMGGAH